MSMAVKQSFSWWCYAGHGVSDDDLMAEAKRIGYPAVDICPAEHFERAHKHGLAISSFPGHRLEKVGLNDLKAHDGIEKTILENLEVAVKNHIPNLIVFSGERGLGISDEEGIENCAVGLKRVAGAAEKAGITLVMELLNSKVNHKDYMCDHTAWGVQVMQAVNSPHVKLLYDIYHMQIMEGDLIRTIQENIQWLGHFHTGGVPGRQELDNAQEVQWDGVMRGIAATSFQGYVAHEFVPTRDPLTSLRQAVDLCDV